MIPEQLQTYYDNLPDKERELVDLIITVSLTSFIKAFEKEYFRHTEMGVKPDGTLYAKTKLISSQLIQALAAELWGLADQLEELEQRGQGAA